MSHAFQPFKNRQDAGQRLAAALGNMNLADAVVLALPRGGVPVAYEVARALPAPLGVLLVRKLGAPNWPEFAIGALAEGRNSHRIIEPDAFTRSGASEEYVEQEAARLQKEIARRRTLYAAPDGTLSPPVTGRTAIVVDDGAATGSTMRVALEALAEEKPARLLFAVPVAPSSVVPMLEQYADAGVCLHAPSDFCAVSMYYAEFRQTTDEEVTALLARARTELANLQ